MAIVDQCRQSAQVVLIGQSLVVNFHKTDAKLIGLIVDILQLLQGLGTLAALLFIWLYIYAYIYTIYMDKD